MKLSELYLAGIEKGKNDMCRFMRDMKRSRLKLIYYAGRFSWKGPAVVADSLQEVLSYTKIPCQWDSMGKGYVIYPKQGI